MNLSRLSSFLDDMDLHAYKESASPFQSIINKSILIHEGPPKKFLLKPDKEECLDNSGKVRRWTFGEQKNCKTRTILMVGETGTGKSTLINAIINYILGVEYKDNIRFEIIKEEKRSQTQSQTTDVTVYEVYGKEEGRVPYSLRIIDTPGYADTQGTEKDENIPKNLKTLFSAEKGVHQIDAVCLVVKSSQNRLTDAQQYIFNAILSLFGKDIENNIVALITFFDGSKSTALEAIDKAGVPCARTKKNEPVSFKFNNGAKEDDCDDEDVLEFSQQYWNMGMRNMKNFFEMLNRMETISVQMTRDVLFEREKLKMTIEGLHKRITEVEAIQSEYMQIQDELKKHQDDIDANKDFTYVVKEFYKEKVSTKSPATSCMVCETTCHYPCTFVSESRLYWCGVMKHDHCTVCESNCHYRDHIKEKKMYKIFTREVTRTFEKLKERFEKATGEKATKENLMKDTLEKLEKAKSDKKKLVEDSYQHALILSKIALQPGSRSTVEHLKFLLERLKEIGTKSQVQEIEDIMTSVEMHNSSALRNPEKGKYKETG